MSFPLALNRLFPRRWRWAVKRLLRLPTGQLGHQLDEIDFRVGSRHVLDVGANDGMINHQDSMRCIELLGKEVMPALRDKAKELGLVGPFEVDEPVGISNEVLQAAD